MTEDKDLLKVSDNLSCRYRAYELQRVEHLNKQINMAMLHFEVDKVSCTYTELVCFNKKNRTNFK